MDFAFNLTIQSIIQSIILSISINIIGNIHYKAILILENQEIRILINILQQFIN